MRPASMPGRYADATEIGRDCTLRCISLDDLDDLEILLDTVSEVHTRVICRVPGIGVLTGHAGVITERSFSLEAGVHQRRRLAGRIGWRPAQALEGPERRGTARVVPAHSDVVVRWGDVEGVGMLRDLSMSGAAVNVASRPPIGFAVKFGRRRATVVRHTETGIGVRFALPLGPENVTKDVVP